jgi:two-component system, sensor histidine kinase and response regulator
MRTIKPKFFQIIRRKELPLYLILIVAGLTLIGWFSDNTGLASYSLNFIPFTHLGAVTYIILSIYFIFFIKLEKSGFVKFIETPLVLLVTLFGIYIFLNYFFKFTWNFETIFIKNPEKFGNVVIGRTSPITSLLVIFICIGLLGIRRNNSKIVKYIGGSFSLLTFIISSILLIGYMFKEPILYGSHIIPVSLPSSICSMLFSVTLLRVYESHFWTFDLIEENKVTRLLLKSFLPIVIIIIIFQGYLITTFSLNLKNPALSVAIILLIVVVITIYIVIRVSTVLGINLVRAEKALKESNEKFSKAIHYAPFPIMIHAENGKVHAISQGWIDLSGYTLFDIPTIEKWTEHAYGSQKQNVKEDINSLYKMIGSKNEGEYTIISKDGTKRIWDFSSAYLGNFEKEGRIVISMAKDVTERKHAENELKTNERKLHQLNIDKDRFISILGHDLKSPFNNILGFSEVLTEDIRKLNVDEIEDIAININKSARITNSLLEDILMWATVQRGKIPFNPQKLSLADICKNILEILNPGAYAKNITVFYSVADNINVYADIDMLKTIILNLVANAIKFSNRGGRININAEQNPGNVIISVSDNGVGIAPDNLAKLFDISEIITTKGTAKETGTGLGLLLCKEFVEKHSGKIWVESEAGKGSEFKFTLPYNLEPKV